MFAKTLKNLRVFILMAYLTMPISASHAESARTDGYIVYTIKPGESLSCILYDKLKLSPVYGIRGYIRKIVSLNGVKDLRDGNLIKPGTTLIIPAATTESKTLGQNSEANSFSSSSGDLKGMTSRNEPLASSVPRKKNRSVAQATEDGAGSVSQSHSKLDAELTFGYLGLVGYQPSNGTQARLLSTLSPSLRLDWIQSWSQKISSSFYINAQSLSFENDQNGVSIKNRSLFRSTFGFGTSYSIVPWLSLRLNGEFLPALFYTGSPGGSIVIQKVPLFGVRAGAEATIVAVRPLSLVLSGGLSGFSASAYDNYSIQTGKGYDGALRVQQVFKKSEGHCEVGYSERRQDTSLISLIEKATSLTCGWGWKL